MRWMWLWLALACLCTAYVSLSNLSGCANEWLLGIYAAANCAVAAYGITKWQEMYKCK